MRDPEAFAPIVNDCRKVLLRRFPFFMVYRVRGDEFLVVAVFHHRRDPRKLIRRAVG